MNVWLEKTYSSQRSLNREWQFKKALLSPIRSKAKRDIYHYMRAVEPGDIVLHLDQTVDQIIGYSKAITKYETITIEDQKYYLIKLDEFIPYIPAINIREFLNDVSRYDQLWNVMQEYEVFYRKHNHGFALRQGAYLTKIVPALQNILDRYIKRSKNTTEQIVREIPEGLLNVEYQKNDISIIIGQNGVGKSQLLTYLAYEFLEKGINTIAISSSIFDKFATIKKTIKKDQLNHFHFLAASKGPSIVNEVMKNFFDWDNNQIVEPLKKDLLNNLLGYIKYEAKIGIRFSESIYKSKNNKLINAEDNQNNFLFDAIERFNDLTEFQENIFWIDLAHDNYYEHAKEYQNIVDVMHLLDQLRAIGYRSSVEYYLSRNNVDIPLLQASSGELMILITILHIASFIDQRSVILIDEPENSLHLEWQKNFIKMLNDLFSEYQPKIIISTHSPLLISTSQFLLLNANVYIAKEDYFALQEKTSHNYESILLDLFEIITPENQSLSNHLIDLLNDLGEEKISYEELLRKIRQYEQKVYDPRQHLLLQDILKVGHEITEKQ